MTLSPSGLLIVSRPDRAIILDRDTSATRRVAALMGIGHSVAIARAVVAGDLAVRVRAVDLGRYIGLLAPVNTTEARAAGLVQ